MTTQHWRKLLASYVDNKNALPLRIRDLEKATKSLNEGIEDQENLERMSAWAERVASGLPSIGDKYERYSLNVNNLDISECYNCDKIAIWVGDRMVWPHPSDSPAPNADLPEDIVADYLEAGEIVNPSPRGAAALLRLAIQKLCKFLGKPGKNINDDIAALVRDGLDPRVQKALDVVRVIGNNAVHPGELDIRDDRATAEKLFTLVNLIADVLISQPKAVDEMYDGLGPGALAAIEKRDGK